MTDSSWIAYVGAVTGIIGSATGIGALWVSLQANKKVASTQLMELRIELGKAIHDVENDLAMLSVLMKDADISRKAVDRLKGDFHPKSTEDWNRNIQTFEKFSEKSRKDLFEQLRTMNKKSVSELEEDIIGIHMVKTNAKSIEKIFVDAKKRYDSELESSRTT